MSINLTKGSGINLTKEAPALARVRFGLGWDANAAGGADFDLDASVFLLNSSGKLLSDAYFVFYGNKTSPDDSTHHLGDNLTGGASTGDDESITVDLSKLAPAVTELSFIVTIYKDAERHQNFGQVSNSYIKLYDDATGAELAQYKLNEDFGKNTAVQFGSLYKDENSHWNFKGVGAGYNKGLGDFVTIYGGSLA